LAHSTGKADGQDNPFRVVRLSAPRRAVKLGFLCDDLSCARKAIVNKRRGSLLAAGNHWEAAHKRMNALGCIANEVEHVFFDKRVRLVGFILLVSS